MARRGRKPNLTLRGAILSLLGQSPQTVAQCASECGSNPVTTKNHINALAELGLVAGGETVKHVNPDTGEASRGRPAQLFEITEAGNAALALDDTTSALTAPEPVEESNDDNENSDTDTSTSDAADSDDSDSDDNDESTDAE